MPAPEVDPLEPLVTIGFDNLASNMPMSRLGQPDLVALSVSAVRAEIKSVRVQVNQAGLTYLVPARLDSGDRWLAAVRFRRPGAATLRASVNWTERSDQSEHLSRTTAQPVVTVEPTQRAAVQLRLGTQVAVQGRLPIPVALSASGPTRLALQVEAAHAAALRVECRESTRLGLVVLNLTRPVGSTVTWQGDLLLPANAAPTGPLLYLYDTDYFGAEQETVVALTTVDNTPPQIEILLPTANQSFVSALAPSSARPFRLQVRGTVRDPQSGYQADSLSYSAAGQNQVPVSVAPNGEWQFELALPALGAYEISLQAADRSGNVGNSAATQSLRFELVRGVRAQTLDALLSPTSYLRELQRFVRDHITKSGGRRPLAVATSDLVAAFRQPIGDIGEADPAWAQRAVNELLAPVRVLRDTDLAQDADHLADSVGLIARWTFSDLARGAPDGMEDKTGRLHLHGSYMGPGRYADNIRNLAGTGGELEGQGALVFPDSDHRARVGVVTTGASSALELGRGGRDFSLSFWFYPSAEPTGPFAQVVYKGDDPGGNTACGLWFTQGAHKLLFRTRLVDASLADCESASILPLQRWTHVACVKSRHFLQIWLNGRLDKELALSQPVQHSPGDLYLGTSPNQPGFVGGLADLRLYGFALEAEQVGTLALSRLAETPGATAMAEFNHLAYETLLRGIGCSVEELRGLSAMSATQRRELAERLGLDAPDGAAPDQLGTLVPANTRVYFEEWLEQRFELPLTYTTTVATGPAAPGPGGLVWMRRQVLGRRWAQEDSGRTLAELDPDQVDLSDLDPEAAPWVQLLSRRRAELDARFQHFSGRLISLPGATGLPTSEVVAEVVGLDEQAKLKELRQDELSGAAIADRLSALALEPASFRRLLAYLEMADGSLSISEGEDLAHLMTQLWKLRQCQTRWQEEEAALPGRLWPTLGSPAAWRPGGSPPQPYPWRVKAAARSAQEARLLGRIRAWQAVQDEQDAAVAEAQRVALPRLRDRLLGLSDLPGAARFFNQLTERWLLDFGASGHTPSTPCEQAIASLQTLINGVRGGWFATGHPASAWGPRDLDRLELQWRGVNSLQLWRSSVLSLLYPESALYPELRAANSARFKTLLSELLRLQPVTAASLSDPGSPVGLAWLDLYNTGVASSNPAEKAEALVFGPLAMGLALQRGGQYAVALEWYERCYKRSAASPYRKPYEPLLSEPDLLAPVVDFQDPVWAGHLDDPHTVQGRSGCRNPYTRFVLFQILHCLLAQADDAFAAGTLDDRSRALGLYLEVSELLDFPELQDRQPPNSLDAAYLPSPLLSSLRAHTEAAVRKLRRGLNFLGMPMAPELGRGAGAALAQSGEVRPTPYRFKLLIERAKQLVAQSQQIESQYLTAMEGTDREMERLMSAGFQLEGAQQTIALRRIQQDEAQDGLALSQEQLQRSQLQRDRYQQWLAAGPSDKERIQIDNLWAAQTARNVIAGLDATLTSLQAFGGVSNLFSIVASGGAELGNAASIAMIAAGRGVAQNFLNDNETLAQVSGIVAAQERRAEEWRLSHDLASQDVVIGQSQLALARDRVQIAAQEYHMASTQASQAQQMLAFLRNKSTSAFFFQWLQGELRQIYALLLRLATVTARNAEAQLAFERQERSRGLVRADYWQLASASAASSGGASSGPTLEAQGITGSARLLQDIYLLDERAFSSEQRLLNLSQSFSLAQLMPIEFEAFRRTGQIGFATPMRWFDEGFPGHHMRLIKKVRVSVAALIPPGQGIRVTLVNSGLSRVVTADPGYPTVVIRQDPQLVALSAPVAATGVFELDMQSELLFPFEGTGVDSSWSLELPPAGNAFDFDSLMDVVLSIDYTARFSPELRERVIKSLPRQWQGERSFSVKRDLPEAWYALANGAANADQVVELPLSSRHFPPGLGSLRVQELVLSIRTVDGQACAYRGSFGVLLPDLQIEAGAVTAIAGLASTRQSAGRPWREALADLPQIGPTRQLWTWRLDDVPASGPNGPSALREQLRAGLVEDILIVLGFAGQRPPW